MCVQDFRNAVCFAVSLFDDREFRVLSDGKKSGVAVLAHLVLSSGVFCHFAENIVCRRSSGDVVVAFCGNCFVDDYKCWKLFTSLYRRDILRKYSAC